MESKFFRWTLRMGLGCVVPSLLLLVPLLLLDSSMVHAIADNSTQPLPFSWQSWGIGVLTSIILILVSIYLSAYYNIRWQEQIRERQFRKSSHTVRYTGSAQAIYALRGKRITLEGVEEDVDLSGDFPSPTAQNVDKTDNFIVQNCELRILGQRASLTATLGGYSSGKTYEWTAKVNGEGRYIPTGNNFKGHIYLQCHMEQSHPAVETGRTPTWAATYIFTTSRNSQKLTGHWLLRDERNPDHVAFGTISLNE